MATNLPAPRDDAPLAVPRADGEAEAAEPRPAVEQNVAVALIPLAVITLLLLAFIAAAWTFVASLPPA